MYGIGVDTTTISRIEKALEKPNFKSFVFGEKEQQLFFNNKIKYSSLAANFAAKEAFSKALGTGVRDFNLNEVEILRDELGKPYFNFSGRAKDIISALQLTCFVSLTHENDFATAFVILHKQA